MCGCALFNNRHNLIIMKSKKPIKLIYPDAVSYVVNDLEKHLKEDLHGMTLKEFAETHGLHYPSLVTLRSRSEKRHNQLCCIKS